MAEPAHPKPVPVAHSGPGLRLRLWFGCLVAPAAAGGLLWWVVSTRASGLLAPDLVWVWLPAIGGVGVALGLITALWLDRHVVGHLDGLIRGVAGERVSDLRGLPSASGWGELSQLTQQIQQLLVRRHQSQRSANELEALLVQLARLREALERWGRTERWEPLVIDGITLAPLTGVLNRTLARGQAIRDENTDAARQVRDEIHEAVADARESAEQTERGFVEATALLTTVRELHRLGGELAASLLRLPAPPESASQASAVEAIRTAAAAAIRDLVTASVESVEHLAAGMLRVQEIADHVQRLANRATLIALNVVAAGPTPESQAEQLKRLARDVREATERTTALAADVDSEVAAAAERMARVRADIAVRLEQLPPPEVAAVAPHRAAGRRRPAARAGARDGRGRHPEGRAPVGRRRARVARRPAAVAPPRRRGARARRADRAPGARVRVPVRGVTDGRRDAGRVRRGPLAARRRDPHWFRHARLAAPARPRERTAGRGHAPARGEGPMSLSGSADEAREIASVLTGALAPVLAPTTSPAAIGVAREIAQVLSLEGLDRLLGACEPHAGVPWPESVEGVIQRLARLCDAAREAGSVAPFTRAEVELSGLAAELEALEWSAAVLHEAGPQPAVATLAIGDVIEDLPAVPGEDGHALERVRVTAPVAAALRAALDWLEGGTPARTLRVTAEDSMLEVWVSGIDPMGLRAASEVLAAVDGNLGPVGGAAPPGTWRIRVPAHSARAAYLMVVQGGLPLALPWHSVLHVHLMADREVATAMPPAAQIAPLAPLVESEDERPVVMVAHGLRRAWLVADRLVWRFPADGCVAPTAAPVDGLDGMVRTDEGESWWRVDVARLLAGVEPLPVPDPARAGERTAEGSARAAERAPEVARAEPAARPTVPPTDAAAAPRPEPAPPDADPRAPGTWQPRTPPPPRPVPPPKVELIVSAPGSGWDAGVSRPPAERPVLQLLDGAAVEPLPEPASRVLEAADVVPEEAVAPPAPPWARVVPGVAETAAPPPAPAAPVAAHAHRALVAEDSMMARLFLMRMLQKRGFEVDAVDSAVTLVSALRRGPWELVCLDVELPDASGVALVAGVRERLEREGSAATLIALVRDPADRAVAHEAAVRDVLHKPFAEDELDALLGRLRGEARR